MKIEQLLSFLIFPNATVVEAMKRLDATAKGILFVVNDERRLLGVITDGDIRRWLIKTGNLQAQIDCIMNRNPITIQRKNTVNARKFMAEQFITALPILTSEGLIQDIIFDQFEIKKKKPDDTFAKVPIVIMAGGRGTRLYPYTKILPKPLIPIGDIPIMERIMNKFQEFGVQEFYATVNYRKSMIKTYFQENEKNYIIHYIEEDKPLGTAGSLTLIEKMFDVPFIVTNCDILIHADYADIYHYHKNSGNDLTVVTALKNTVIPYGVIQSSENGMICSVHEKPKLSHFVNTGMYILNPELVKDIPKNSIFHMTDLLNKLLNEKRKAGMYPISEDSFLDMGEFEEMHRMEEKLDLKSE